MFVCDCDEILKLKEEKMEEEERRREANYG